MDSAIKRGQLIEFEDGTIGVFGGRVGKLLHCPLVYDYKDDSLYFNQILEKTTDIKPVKEKNFTLPALYQALIDLYSFEEPDWIKNWTDSTYYEIMDWLRDKMCVEEVDFNDEDGWLNEVMHDTIADFARHIFESPDFYQEESMEKYIDMNAFADAVLDIEIDKKNISTSNDIMEMHEATCRNLHSKLSNIRYGSEVVKSTSNKKYTETQIALFELLWSSLAELKKRDVDLIDLFEWKLND